MLFVCVRHGPINLEARNRHRPALRLPHELLESGAALFRLLIIVSSSAVDMSGRRDTRQNISRQQAYRPTQTANCRGTELRTERTE
jgi:hypothetical protein